MLLCGACIVADVPGGLGQRVGRPLQLADHTLQLAVETVEVLAQVGDFVTAVGVQAPSQVAFAAGDIAHGLHSLLQGAGNAARNQQDYQCHQQGNTHTHQRGIAQLAGEFGLHVIDVHARTDDPAPGFEQLDIGSLGHRLVGTGFGPAVVDRPCTLLAGQGDHFVEYGKAVGVANGRKVLAIELGVGRMHDHLWPQVVDPEVVIVVVAQRTYHLQCLLLGGFAAERAGRLQPLVIGQHASGGLHHMAGFFRFGLVKVTVDLAQHKQPQHHQHGHRHHKDQPQAPADRHRS